MTSKEQLQETVKAYVESLEKAARNEFAYDEDADEYSTALDAWFAYVLDVDFILGARKEYRGVIITLGCGGPNIYFDTREGYVKGYWGGDFAEYHVQSWAVAAVDEYWEEQAEMLFGM